MIELIIFVALMTIVMLGDIIVDFVGEAIWNIGLRTQNLNFMKKRRPQRTHYKFR